MPEVGGQDEGRIETDRFLRHGRGQARRVEDDEAVHLLRSIQRQHDPERSPERATDEDRLLKSQGIEERAHGLSVRRDASVLPGKRAAAVVTGRSGAIQGYLSPSLLTRGSQTSAHVG